MQTALCIGFGILLGGLCGFATVCWAHRMLQNRQKTERVTRTPLLIAAAAMAGGYIGFRTAGWIPLLFALLLMTVCLTVGITDWLCRRIPNPTVLALFALKLLLGAGALLKLPGLPAFEILSSLGGMVFCFALFFAPGLFGRQVGAGDIKLAAAMGFLLGFRGSLIGVVIMGLLVIVYSVAQRKMPLLAFLKTDIPMGPFLAAGTLISYLLLCTTV